MARLPDPQLARQWRQRLDRFEHSDLTVARFCEAEGCSTYYEALLPDVWRGCHPESIRVYRDAEQASRRLTTP